MPMCLQTRNMLFPGGTGLPMAGLPVSFGLASRAARGIHPCTNEPDSTSVAPALQVFSYSIVAFRLQALVLLIRQGIGITWQRPQRRAIGGRGRH